MIIRTTVVKVERRSRVLRTRKVGDEVVSETEDLGWYVLFERSYEMLYAGHQTEPPFRAGEPVMITITGAAP